MLDGLLVIDKPSGPSSHDVVARMRRVLGERRIGHTGTLDPLATGVLPLVLGRATRLARFMSASSKSYEAVVRLGVSTDTADSEGSPIGSSFTGTLPSRDEIDRALEVFRGTFLQQPPAFSAKKIGGRRSHRIARDKQRLRPCRAVGGEVSAIERAGGAPAPVEKSWRLPDKCQVTVSQLTLTGLQADLVTLTLDCSAGFYVRSLAHDLGQALGTGAHLEALRRTRSGGFTLDGALGLAEAEQHRDRARDAVVPLAEMLPELPSVMLTPDGVRHAVQGRDLGPGDLTGDLGLGIRDSENKSRIPDPESRYVRLFDSAGALVGIAGPSKNPGSLHPFVVLM